MAYNIIKGRVEFSNSTTGSIESLVDDWRSQTIGGVKTFSSTVSASAFWDTAAGGEVRALKSLIAGDGANRVLTSDGDGTLTAESKVTFVDPAFTVTGHITGSTFSGSAHGLTGIILNKDHLAATNYDGLVNRLSASNIVLGIGISSSVDPGGTGHGAELQVTGGTGIIVDGQGVQVLTASNGGLAFTGQTLQVDASKTTNKSGGPSNNDEFIIADSSASDAIKNLTYSQIKTAITDSIAAPAITSYTNNGNNRIITSVNSTTVNAETNLSYDGITLAVSGAGNAQRGTFSISGAFDVPLLFVDGWNGRIGMNNDEPGTTLQITERTAAPVLGLHRSSSAWYSDGDDIGDILWAGSALGASYAGAARMRVEADGSEWNSTSYPTRISFWTTQTGSSSPSQRMTINNSGNVGIGTTTIPHTLTVAGTVSASLGVSALSFTGDGSGLTGVTGEWDGSHVGNASITGSLYLTDALSASSGITGSSFVSLAENGASSDRKVIIINGQVSASHTVTATSFVGDGSGLTGVTGEWDGSHTGNATIIGTLSASNGFRGLDLVLDAGGTGRIGVTGDTDLVTLTANQVAVAGALSASLGVTGSAAAFYSSTGAGGQKTITLQDGIVSGSGVSTLHRLDANRIAVDTGDVETLTVTTLIGGSPLSISASAITFSGSVDFSGSSTISASAGTIGALTSSAISGGSPLTLYGDDVTVVANSTTAANFTESHVSSSLAVSASSFWVNGVSVATVGAVSAVANGANNRLATFSSADALNGEANLTFDGTTFSVTGESWLTGSVRIDKNHTDTDSATITCLEVDFDKVGSTTSANTMYGLNIDMDNTTATNGTNYMYGLHVTPTLAHAADAGASFVYGAHINAQGGTNGTSLVQGARIEAAGGDFNYGIQLDVEDGPNNVDLRIESSADNGDYFQIQTTTHGATTFTTQDDDGAAAHLTCSIDGDIVLNAVRGLSASCGQGVHITGSTARLAIGDKAGLGPQDGMLSIRPTDTSNKVLALFQAAEADGQRTCFGVTGSGQVLVGGLHLGGVFNVSGSDTEHLISAKSNTLNPAFSVTGIGEMFVGQSSYLSGAVRHRYVVKTTSADTYISGATDRVAVYNLSSPHNAYLPELNDSLNGVTITVKSVGSANVTLTGSTNTAQLIDSAANKVLETGDSVTVMGYTGPSGYQWAILNYYNAS